MYIYITGRWPRRRPKYVPGTFIFQIIVLMKVPYLFETLNTNKITERLTKGKKIVRKR